MSEAPTGSLVKSFPIQLRRMEVGEINYSCSGFPIPQLNPISEYELETGLSPITSETKVFQVSLKFNARNNQEKTGVILDYRLSVRINAEFAVVSDSFPWDKLSNWAQLNGSAVLMPFLRESVHSISVKSGFKPFIMPLVEAPLYKVLPPANV